MTSIDPRALRNAFGAYMTGVTVVTAHAGDGTPLGFTANSFTSVSLDPPLVLVCLANSSGNYDAFVQAEGFAVNVLSEEQIELSNRFARPSADRFAGVDWQNGPQGSPVLNGVSAWFDCKMHKTVEAGDHVILIGEVKAFESAPSPGLGYVRGAYVTPTVHASAMEQNSSLVVSALIERDGQVLLVDDGNGGVALPERAAAEGGVSPALQDLLSDTGLQAVPGFVYAVYEDVDRKRQHIVFLCQAADGAPRRGAFVRLDLSALDDVTDPATLSMLMRFVREAELGHFGFYYGNQTRGNVRTTA